MTVLEQRYLERMPSILLDLVKELGKLTKEVAELKEELKNKR